jgi:hypothetical protein
VSAALRGPGAAIDEHTVRAELRLLHTAGLRCALLVEGPSDARFWQGHLRPGAAAVICGGRHTLLAVLTCAAAKGQGWVWGAADADCDRLEGALRMVPQLAYTDAHDLEATLAMVGGLRRLLLVHGDAAKVTAWAAKGQAAEEALLHAAADLGRLRWLARRAAVSPSMDWLVAPRFFDPATLSLRWGDVLRAAAQKGLGASPADVQAALDALPPADPWQLAQGHDLVHLVSAALGGVLGGSGSGRAPGDVERALCVGVGREALAQTAMGAALRSVGGGGPLV